MFAKNGSALEAAGCSWAQAGSKDGVGKQSIRMGAAAARADKEAKADAALALCCGRGQEERMGCAAEMRHL